MNYFYVINFRKSGAHGGMILTGNPKNSEKNLSQYHFVHHRSHWIDLGANPGCRGEKSVTNRLSHGTANMVFPFSFPLMIILCGM
jgi:hypothetical protein